MIDERKWRLSALGVRSSIFLIMLLGIIDGFRDFFGDYLDLFEFFAGGGVEGFASEVATDIALYLLTIIAYITCMCGLGSFANVQETEWDASGVRKVRGGFVWSFVAAILACIPLVGWIFGFAFSVVAFFVSLGGYNRLKNSSTFPKMARLGAALLFAAMFVELLGDILGLLPFVGSLLQGLLYVVVIFMVMSGWKKIERADVAAAVQGETVEVVTADVVVVSTETQSSQQMSVSNSEGEPVVEKTTVAEPLNQKKFFKRFIIAGSVLLMLVVGVVALCFLSGGEDCALHFPAPKWDKFVVAKRTGVKAYRLPDKNSLRLCIAHERLASCEAGRELCWSDRRSDSDWEVRTLNIDSALPVIEELDGWYKVQVGDAEMCEPVIAYVEKRNFKEVFAKPVTFAQFEKIQGTCWDGCMVSSGKYEGKCLIEDLSDYEMSGIALLVGEILDGAFVCMRPEHYINIYKLGDEPLRIVCDKDKYWNCEITYAESKAREYEIYPDYTVEILDVNKLTVEEIESVIDAGFFNITPSAYSVYYYIPDVDESLMSFKQMSDDFYLNN